MKNIFAALLILFLIVFQIFSPNFAIAEDEVAAPEAPSAVEAVTEPEPVQETASSETEPLSEEHPAEIAPDTGSVDNSGDISVTLASTTPSETSTPASEATTTEDVLETTSTSTTTATTTEQVSDSGISIENATGTPTIVTGESVATANILNLVNTNFVNAEGAIIFTNLFSGEGDIDFRNTSTSSCPTQPCASGDSVTINNLNDAFIRNYIMVQANSGNNSIQNAAEGTIDTGNAYAGLNLINLANSNFVDSNYLLVTLNAFNGVNGDIVFPSLSNFFSSLVQSSNDVGINLQNSANVSNNVNAETGTGENSTENVGDSTIHTGEAHSNTNVFNSLNTNLVGSENISILFRIHGSWVGEIFGAPSELSWIQGDDGSVYLFDNESASSTSSSTQNDTDLNISGTNTALIQNDVSVIALTGNNKISDSQTALIQTGDAYAGANVVNVANTNVVGKNWIMAIINIFGDFTGNIAFGRPDLWVGEQVEVPTQIVDGSELTYKFSVINNGDSESTETVLKDDFDNTHLEILESSLPYTEDENGNLVWNLESIPAGMATEITYKARVTNTGSETEIINVVSVGGRETDNNMQDNTDTATVVTRKLGGGTRNRKSEVQKEIKNTATIKNLEVTRTNFSSFILSSDVSKVSHQTFVVYNPTNQEIKNIIVKDILKNSKGEIVSNELFNLGNILPNEEITIEYDLKFRDDVAPGIYYFGTKVETTGSQQSFPYNGSILIGFPLPQTNIEAPKTIGEVLGTTTEEYSDDSFVFDLNTATAYAFDDTAPLPPQKFSIPIVFTTITTVLSTALYLLRKPF